MKPTGEEIAPMKNDAATESEDTAPAGFSVRHLDEDTFESEGLRAFFEYRDLGIKQATGGRFGAHVIRAKAGMGSQAQWHQHGLDFQMVYVLRGWVVFEYEGVGKVRLVPGSCVHQPPGIRHRELEHSDDLELIEITAPAEFSSEDCKAP